MKRRRSQNKVVVRQADGQPVEVELGEFIDLREPQIDDKMGIAPEFVNITRKVQLNPIPDQPGETLEIPPMGILRGAQWRHMSLRQPAWGKTPPFVERIPMKVDKETGRVIEGYDPKHLLTTAQAVDHIERLSNRDRIRQIIEHGVYVETDEVTRLGYRRNHAGPVTYRNSDTVDARPRAADGREEVTSTAMKRIFFLEDQERRSKEEAGLLEAGGS